MTSQKDRAGIDVLIAEDDGPLRATLRQLLEGRGYTCAEAGDGREALALAQQVRPRCVLLDLVMPGMDGFTVTRLLRSDPRTQPIHIHCVTGLSDPGARKQAEEAGCERFLVKPVDPSALLEAVGTSAGQEGVASVSGLTLAQAEELLDWLQNQGCTGLQTTLDDAGVTVRCVCPAGRRLVQGKDGRVRLVRG